MTSAMTLLPLLAVGGLPPPLVHLLEAARQHNQALSISRAQLAEQDAAVRQALAALTPTVKASGSYTRNQYEAVVSFPKQLFNGETLTLQPYNGWSANIALNVPLFSAPNLYRYAEARRARKVTEAGERASDAEVLLSTAKAYYQVVGSQDVVEAAAKAVATADDNLKVTQVKLSAGTQTRVAVDRAQVDLARARQTLASSRRALALARRTLETLSGEVLPEAFAPPGDLPPPADAEASYVLRAQGQRREVQQTRDALAQQDLAVKEAWAQVVPSLTGNLSESFTNVTGFTNQSSYWTAGLSLGVTLDPVGTPAAVKRAQAAADEQRHRLQQTLDAVRDDVHAAWLEVDAEAALREQASSEMQSAQDALAITQQQYAAGTATSLDLSQAQRDAFTAEATYAQSRADLAAALLALKKAAGDPLLAEDERSAP